MAAVVDLRRPPADLAAAGLPRLHSLHPCCVLADQPGTVTLVGAAISGSTDLVLCRQQCRHLGSTAVDGSGAAASSSSVSASASASGGSGHSSSTQLLTQHLLSSTSVAESRKADGQAGGQELRFIAPQGVLPGEWRVFPTCVPVRLCLLEARWKCELVGSMHPCHSASPSELTQPII